MLPPCKGCGACCTLFVELVGGLDDVPEEMIVVSGKSIYMDTVDGHCCALNPETNECTIYEQRPVVCRNFERGCSLCKKVAAYAKLNIA